jgi:hypothetical protein
MLGDLHDGGDEAATDAPAEGSGRDDEAVECEQTPGRQWIAGSGAPDPARKSKSQPWSACVTCRANSAP